LYDLGAVEVQLGMAERNVDVPQDSRIDFRIGIHLGDILVADPENQIAQRLLGLTITDQFEGQTSDRYGEAEKMFQNLSDPYERFYYLGLLQERRAKAQMRAGRPAQMLIGSFQEAMRCFEEAEKIRPPRNDDAVLRWNRCVRLLEKIGEVEGESLESFLEDHDTAPVEMMRRFRIERAAQRHRESGMSF